MPSIRMTALFVDNLPLPESGRVDYHDLEVPGLMLRVSASGVKAWSVMYRFHGPLRRLTIGQHPGVSLKMARERAREARASIQRGVDPVAEKKAKERDERENGFSSCVEDFIEKYAKPRLRTWAKVDSVLKRLAVPAWGNRPVKEIRRRDVADLLDATPHQANHLRAFLSKFFNWLIEREVVDINPVIGVSRRQKPQVRDRVLTDAEVVALWKATIRLGDPFGPAVRFLLLTGVRRSEASCLRWNELDLTNGWANLPGSRMKNGRDFKLPLSSDAKKLLESQHRFGDYVFTTTGDSPISGWGKAKRDLIRFMVEELREPVKSWRLHDLRRTVSSGLARLGYSWEVRQRVLAHAPKGADVTNAVYNWHDYDEEAKDALQKWGARITRLTSGLYIVPDPAVATVPEQQPVA